MLRPARRILVLQLSNRRKRWKRQKRRKVEEAEETEGGRDGNMKNALPHSGKMFLAMEFTMILFAAAPSQSSFNARGSRQNPGKIKRPFGPIYLYH